MPGGKIYSVMIIDFHTHIFPDAVRANRDHYFHGESAFKLLYAHPQSKLAGVDEIINNMNQEEVDCSVIFGFPWQSMHQCRLGNDYVIEAVNKNPDRLIGFSCVNPFDQEASQEVERCIAAGLKGVGELAFYHSGFDDKAFQALQPIMKICCQNNLPVLIHTNEPIGHQYPGKTPVILKQIYALAQSFPDNKIVLAHWGGGIFFYTLLKKEVKDTLKNIYYDTAASPFLYNHAIYPLACQLAGLDKILFGSDFPLIKPSRYFKEMKKCGLGLTEIKRLCGDNAARIFDKKL